jgi:hypothetical protein
MSGPECESMPERFHGLDDRYPSYSIRAEASVLGCFCPRPSADLALPGIPEGAEGDVKSSNSVSANWSRHVCELATGATILGFSTAQPFDVMVPPLQIERVYAFARRGQTFSEFQISAHLVTLDTLRSTRVPSGVVSIARQHAASTWYGLRHGASGESVIETGVSPAPGVGLFLAGSYCPAGEPPAYGPKTSISAFLGHFRDRMEAV